MTHGAFCKAASSHKIPNMMRNNPTESPGNCWENNPIVCPLRHECGHASGVSGVSMAYRVGEVKADVCHLLRSLHVNGKNRILVSLPDQAVWLSVCYGVDSSITQCSRRFRERKDVCSRKNCRVCHGAFPGVYFRVDCKRSRSSGVSTSNQGGNQAICSPLAVARRTVSGTTASVLHAMFSNNSWWRARKPIREYPPSSLGPMTTSTSGIARRAMACCKKLVGKVGVSLPAETEEGRAGF